MDTSPHRIWRGLATVALGGMVLLASGCLGDPPKQSGVYVSSDTGVSWAPIPNLAERNGRQSRVYPPLAVTAVASAPADTNNITAGTNQDIYHSTDGGKGWSKLTGNLPNRDAAVSVLAIAYHPTDANTFYVAGVSGGYGKIYKTINNGGAWQAVFAGATRAEAVTSIIVTSNPDVVFVGDQIGNVYKSSNAGGSWQRILAVGSPVTSLSVAGNAVYAGTAGQGVFRSNDSGGSFSAINGNLTGQQLTVWSVAAGLGGLYVGTDDGIFVTRDFGATWQSVGSPLPEGGQRVQSIALASGRVIFATSGVVYQMAPDGSNFIPVQLQPAQTVFAVTAGRADTSILYAAANSKDNFPPGAGGALPNLFGN